MLYKNGWLEYFLGIIGIPWCSACNTLLSYQYFFLIIFRLTIIYHSLEGLLHNRQKKEEYEVYIWW